MTKYSKELRVGVSLTIHTVQTGMFVYVRQDIAGMHQNFQSGQTVAVQAYFWRQCLFIILLIAAFRVSNLFL